MRFILTLGIYLAVCLSGNSYSLAFDEIEYSKHMDNGADYFEPLPFSQFSDSSPRLRSLSDVIIDYPITPFTPDILNAEGYREYEVVIIANKAIRGAAMQTLNIYKNGQPYSFGKDEFDNPIHTISVSTGRIFGDRSVTPKGYFTPTFLSRNHKQSKTGVPMPFAVFFYGNYAIHRVPFDHQEEFLGQAVSAGCVRVSKQYVPQIFDLVEQAGRGLMPKIHRNGELILNNKGEIQREMKFKTLIIVQDVEILTAYN